MPKISALVPCGDCGCHVRLSETSCPHCGASLRSNQGGLKRSTAAMLAGLSTAAFLSVAACGSDEDGSGGSGGDGGTTMSDGGGGSTSTGTPTGANVGGVYGVGPGGFGGEGGTGANVGGAYGVGPGGAGGAGGGGGGG